MVDGQDTVALYGPVLGNDTSDALANRKILLRAWIEIGTWYAHFTKQYGSFRCLSTVNIGFPNGYPPIPQRGSLNLRTIMLGPQSGLSLLKNSIRICLVYTWNNVSVPKPGQAQVTDSRPSSL
jgi:hypothetical protein